LATPKQVVAGARSTPQNGFLFVGSGNSTGESCFTPLNGMNTLSVPTRVDQPDMTSRAWAKNMREIAAPHKFQSSDVWMLYNILIILTILYTP
jgi:hypothetical protein